MLLIWASSKYLQLYNLSTDTTVHCPRCCFIQIWIHAVTVVQVSRVTTQQLCSGSYWLMTDPTRFHMDAKGHVVHWYPKPRPTTKGSRFETALLWDESGLGGGSPVLLSLHWALIDRDGSETHCNMSLVTPVLADVSVGHFPQRRISNFNTLARQQWCFKSQWSFTKGQSPHVWCYFPPHTHTSRSLRSSCWDLGLTESSVFVLRAADGEHYTFWRHAPPSYFHRNECGPTFQRCVHFSLNIYGAVSPTFWTQQLRMRRAQQECLWMILNRLNTQVSHTAHQTDTSTI